MKSQLFGNSEQLVRFPYELLKVLQNPFSLKILFYIIRFVGQEAKTSPSHGENRGSIPLRTVLKRSLCGSVFCCFASCLFEKARQLSCRTFYFIILYSFQLHSA